MPRKRFSSWYVCGLLILELLMWSLMVIVIWVWLCLGVDSVCTVPASLVTYASIQALQPDLIINAGTAGGFKVHTLLHNAFSVLSFVSYVSERINIIFDYFLLWFFFRPKEQEFAMFISSLALLSMTEGYLFLWVLSCISYKIKLLFLLSLCKMFCFSLKNFYSGPWSIWCWYAQSLPYTQPY